MRQRRMFMKKFQKSILRGSTTGETLLLELAGIVMCLYIYEWSASVPDTSGCLSDLMMLLYGKSYCKTKQK